MTLAVSERRRPRHRRARQEQERAGGVFLFSFMLITNWAVKWTDKLCSFVAVTHIYMFYVFLTKFIYFFSHFI